MRKRFELSVSVFVVVERGREVLLLRREATGWKDGWYSLPAGGLDGGERSRRRRPGSCARIVEPDKHDAIGWFDRDALPDRTIDYTRQALAAIGSGQLASAFGWPADRQ